MPSMATDMCVKTHSARIRKCVSKDISDVFCSTPPANIVGC